MSGAGNTFLVADGRPAYAVRKPEEVRAFIREHSRVDGKSIEGVLILVDASMKTIVADFYNPDGSHGMMCGNGARCIVRYACDSGLAEHSTVKLLLNGREYQATIHSDNTIAVTFDAPKDVRHYPVGSLSGIHEDVWYVNVGSDHVVIGGPLDPQRQVVGALRHHEEFPKGVNVNMVTSNATNHIATFERGVEAVTGACGTGALSAAVVLWKNDPTRTTCVLVPPSGRPLQTFLTTDNATITSMTLRGDALYDNA